MTIVPSYTLLSAIILSDRDNDRPFHRAGVVFFRQQNSAALAAGFFQRGSGLS